MFGSTIVSTAPLFRECFLLCSQYLIKHSLNNAYLTSVFTTRSRTDNTEVYVGSCLERGMADGWYGEWTDWRNDSEQQAPKEPPKKRLRPYAFHAAS